MAVPAFNCMWRTFRDRAAIQGAPLLETTGLLQH